MSASKMALTPRDVEVLAIAWFCFIEEPKIDMDKFASMAGYTRKSAVVTIGNLKRKIKTSLDPNDLSAGIRLSTPKKAASTPKKTATTPKDPKSSGRKRYAAEDVESPVEKKSKTLVQHVQDEEDFKIKIEDEGYGAVEGGYMEEAEF
ncbi:hypothetical protein CC78DRAFT_601642 [Lojkania enalia]|uniref:Uncharacterized protein n=1 Tax=Lojkania enalia TaxID=147567 RepID=A0A9P4K965_9PLEO|nr:hypothetical protein CC78DRAFT_601642 [Didymosphaeria enalia]